MMTGRKHWLIVGCYVPPWRASETKHIVTALGHFPYDAIPILVVDLKFNLSQPDGREPKNDLVAMFLVNGLNYMAYSFRTRQGGLYRRTWSMAGQQWRVASQKNYVVIYCKLIPNCIELTLAQIHPLPNTEQVYITKLEILLEEVFQYNIW